MAAWSTRLFLFERTGKFSCWNFCHSFTSSKHENLIENLLTMPKEKGGKSHAQRQKAALKEKSKWKNENPSSIYLQVVGTGANGTPRALSVFTTHQRYLFNCGEGTQRIANENKIKLSRLENIFITHKNWDNIGGLPGLTLTIQDIGLPEINIHGPPGIENLYTMTRGFLKIKQIKISKHEYFDEPFEDQALKIETIPLFSSTEPEERNEIKSDEEFSDYCSSSGSSDGGRISPSPTSKPHHKRKRKKKKTAPSPTPSSDNRDVSIAYICKSHPTPGRLLLQRCVELGVPVGPLLGKLKNGEDVTLTDGTVVLSKDVSTPSEPGPIFIVVECPTVNFLDSLLNAPQFRPHQTTAATSSDCAEVVVHFTPAEVINHSKYKEWMRRFSTDTQHLLLNESCPGIANISIFRIQQKLNLIHPEIFPLLNSESREAKIDIVKEDVNVVLAEPLLQYHLKPKTRFDRSGILTIKPEEYLEEVEKTAGSAEAFEELRKSLKGCKIQPLSDREYPIITFLGTGSSIPSRVRNVSGILVHMSPDRCLLMDCGEGTFGQILRFYGWEETLAILKKLSVIFISHLHADHHTGLLKILNERRKACLSTDCASLPLLHLVAPHQISSWLKQYHKEFNSVMDQFTLVPNFFIRHAYRQIPDDQFGEMLKKMDLVELSSVSVLHCLNAYGVTLTHRDGWKLVYSGDTMPCDELVVAGKNCDLLIHEATMEDELIQDAKMKTHSTTSQAIEVGRKMNARFTMLTHFSQRYAKVPLFTDNFHSGVGVAFDNMKISLKNVCLTPLFIPILKVIFTEDYDVMQDRGLRRKRRHEYEAAEAESKLAKKESEESVKDELPLHTV